MSDYLVKELLAPTPCETCGDLTTQMVSVVDDNGVELLDVVFCCDACLECAHDIMLANADLEMRSRLTRGKA